MLKETELAKGTAGQGRPSLGGHDNLLPKDAAPKLSEIGITKQQSSDWQRVADIPATSNARAGCSPCPPVDNGEGWVGANWWMADIV
jgi:hypothetical protein